MPKRLFAFGGKKKRKIHAVINENSGKDKGREAERDFIMKMWEEAFGNDQYPDNSDIAVHRTRTLTDLDKAKDEIRDERPMFVLVFGGDGTIQKLLGEEDGLLQHLMSSEHPPNFIFYECGSTNTIKKEFNLLGRDPVKATATIIEKIKSGTTPLDVIYRHILKINGKHGFIYGAGFPSTLLKHYNAKSPKGVGRILKIGVLWLIMELFYLLPFWRKHTVARKVRVTHEFWSEDRRIGAGVGNRSSVVASPLTQIGMGCRLTYLATKRVGHFHVVLASLGFWRSVVNIPNMFFGLPLSGTVEDEVVTKVVLRYGEPVTHTIDGELFDSEEMTDTVTIERGPLLHIVRE